MGSSDGRSLFPIPNNVRKTIQHIREITGKQHSDDEIFAVLTDCSMDPNETTQKLLFLDTFHEVSRRRDRKKESLSSKALEDPSSRFKQDEQGRGRRSASAGYSSKFSDGGGRRKNQSSRRENAVNHIAERGHRPSTQPVLEKKKVNTTLQAAIVAAAASNGPLNQSYRSSGHYFADQSLLGTGKNVSRSSSAVNDTSNEENVQPQAAVASSYSPIQPSGSVTSSDQGNLLPNSDQLSTSASVSGAWSPASDPVVVPSISKNLGVCGAINREVGNPCLSGGTNYVKGNKTVLHEVVDLPSSENEKTGSMDTNCKNKTPNKLNNSEKDKLSETSWHSSSVSCNGSLRSAPCCDSQSPRVSGTVNASATSGAGVQFSTESRQHVTFPNHFQVPKALKTGLTFGSFDNIGQKERASWESEGDNTSAALESSPQSVKTATSSNQRPLLSAQGDHVEYSHSPSLGSSITVSDSKHDQPKQDVLLATEGPPVPNGQSAQNYGLNFMSTMLGTQQVQFEGSEPQAHETSRLPNFVTASSSSVPTPSPTPPLQSSTSVSPQSVSIYRPPYHPSFFPYGHYYPPIYLSPMHQFLSHNGFPQQPSVGNMYLPAAAAGIKFPLPQFKAGANTGNAEHIGIPPGSFITPPVGYAPSTFVNNGSTTGNEAVSQSKENQNYTNGQLSEGPAVWIPAPGQDISNFQINSLYNLTPQGHLSGPPTQNGTHGAFGGIYHPGQTIVSPSTFLQQSHSVAGAVETVGPPSSAYQQPQHSHIKWNSNF